MAAITWKCPNCGGELVFDPAGQNYTCPFCNSAFTQKELDAMAPSSESAEKDPFAGMAEEKEDLSHDPYSSHSQEKPFSGEEASEGESGQEALMYRCPSCGAEVVTEPTTAATFCYYCHNPIVLEGRVSGKFLPKKIIPFQIDRAGAQKKFLEYVKKKRYIPKAFYDESQLEKLTGVYYPYWCYSAKVDADLSASARKIRTWRTGETEYTETTVYDIQRRGKTGIRNLLSNALQSADKSLVEQVQPFSLSKLTDFSMGYLSGFVAEKRDMESTEFSEAMQQNVRKYSDDLVRRSIGGYASVQVTQSRYEIESENWDYILLPVWVLTYAGRDGKKYYYAMNGENGTIAGVFPIDRGRLGITSAAAAAGVAAIGMLISYFVF